MYKLKAKFTQITANRLFFLSCFMLSSCSPSHPTLSLHDAAKSKNIQQVKENLYWGCDVNTFGEDGYTPLHWACSNNDLPIAKLLLDAGADPTLECGRTADFGAGMNAFHLSNNPAVLTELLSHNHGLLNSRASRYGTSDITFRPAGQTALHIAAAYGNSTLVDYLLQQGIDREIKDDEGHTALYVAEHPTLDDDDMKKRMKDVVEKVKGSAEYQMKIREDNKNAAKFELDNGDPDSILTTLDRVKALEPQEASLLIPDLKIAETRPDQKGFKPSRSEVAAIEAYILKLQAK